jgi:hypothetical protein
VSKQRIVAVTSDRAAAALGREGVSPPALDRGAGSARARRTGASMHQFPHAAWTGQHGWWIASTSQRTQPMVPRAVAVAVERGEPMARLMTFCPTTGRSIAVGVEIDPSTWRSARLLSGVFVCSVCSRSHRWTKYETYLDLATVRPEPAAAGSQG